MSDLATATFLAQEIVDDARAYYTHQSGRVMGWDYSRPKLVTRILECGQGAEVTRLRHALCEVAAILKNEEYGKRVSVALDAIERALAEVTL